jgi:hypothetical protein
VPQQHSPDWRWNHANDRVTQVLSAILEPPMHPAHALAPAAHIAVQQHNDFDMAALPDDILPNIFSRLPAPEVFGLSQVSKRFLHCSRPVMRDWALRELAATTPDLECGGDRSGPRVDRRKPGKTGENHVVLD